MLIIMHAASTPAQIETVKNKIIELNLTPHLIPGQNRCAIGITGNKTSITPDTFSQLDGVIQAISVTKPYKLISREVKTNDTVIDLKTVKIGGNDPAIIAGPCAIEGEELTLEIANQLAEMGVKIFRAGAYKPRTSPYSFQGLREEGYKILDKVRKETGMKVISEVTCQDSLQQAESYIDIVQIGTRNMYNYELLKAVGKCKLPVLLKRGMSATLDEFLFAAEYILQEGNYNIILCERGIRTFSDFSRNTFDINIVPKIKEICHLPILVDPSHACGERNMVMPIARAGIAAGADGLIIEVHQNPPEAVSDGRQSLFPMQFDQLQKEIHRIKNVIN